MVLRGESIGQPMMIIAGMGTSQIHFYFHMPDVLLSHTIVCYGDWFLILYWKLEVSLRYIHNGSASRDSPL